MRKLIDPLKALDPFATVAAVLLFAGAFMLGQHTASKDTKKHYIVDASEVEVVYHDPYKNLTLGECVTDWECETAQLIADKQDGKLVRIDDPTFFPDAIPVIEPIDCGAIDKECVKANKLNAGKPAQYPTICGSLTPIQP